MLVLVGEESRESAAAVCCVRRSEQRNDNSTTSRGAVRRSPATLLSTVQKPRDVMRKEAKHPSAVCSVS